MLLKDKVVLVTGSTTGIGEAIARRCVTEGAKVMLHGREETKAKALIAELGKAAAYTITDLQNTNDYEVLVNNTIKTFGRIDCLVNNAGIYPRNNIESVTEELFNQVVNVNMKAPLFLSKYAVQAFRKQGNGGTIVNIGSMNAYCGQIDLLIYAMTKGALTTMTRNLGDALGREHVRVNGLNIGWVVTDTEIALKKREGFPDNWEEQVPRIFAPSGKLLRPHEIAAHVVFWLSDQSAPANGVVCDVEQYPLIGRNLITEIKL